MDTPPLSDDARAVMRAARQLAVGAGSDRADGLQILAAMIDVQPASDLLGLFSVDPAKLREAAMFIEEHGGGSLDRSAEERTVEYATDEAGRLGHAETGPEHLLLGIARQHDSVAAAILQAHNVTLDDARVGVRFLRGEVTEWDGPRAHPPGDWSQATQTFPLSVDRSPEAREVAMKMAERMSPFMAAEADRLLRVVAVGKEQEQSGVRVELIALELREGRTIIHWRAHSARERLLGHPTFQVSDDLGTAYDVLPASSGGGGGESRGEAWVTPIPTGANRLRIGIASFGDDLGGIGHPMMPHYETTAGPWDFDVSLA